jgi:hypothetical protein
MGVQVAVEAPRATSDEATSPFRVDVARDALDADLAEDCDNLGIDAPDGEPFDWWLDDCGDVVSLWVGVSTPSPLRLRVGTGFERPPQDPTAVFPLFDEFDTLSSTGWSSWGSPTSASGRLRADPAGALFGDPLFGPDATFTVDLVVGPARPWVFEIGAGSFTSQSPRTWEGFGGWLYADASNFLYFESSDASDQSLPPLALAGGTELRVQVEHSRRLLVNGIEVAGARAEGEDLGGSRPLLTVGGAIEAERAFVEPTDLRSVTVAPLGPGPGPGPDGTGDVGSLPIDPGCACSSAGGGAWWLVVLPWALRRRR